MIPLLLAAIGVGTAWTVAKKKKTRPRKTPKALPRKVAATHAAVMRQEFRPKVLEKFAKLFGAEGYPQLSRELSKKSRQIRDQARVVPEIVQRARAGDQNAMAMITAVRENAAHGLARAQVTCELIEKYCLANPVPPKPGDELFENDETDAVEVVEAS